MKIKADVLAQIAENNQLKARLSGELNKSSFTIHKWITDNHENLTLAASLKIIREELNLTDAQILEEETKAA